MRIIQNYSCGYTEDQSNINKIRYGLLNNYSYNMDSCKNDKVENNKIICSKCSFRKDKKK